LRAFDSNRMAAAATVLRAGRRTRLAGSGIGLDVARFGAEALHASGHEAFAEHAHDLVAFPSRFTPDETIVGIDTDAPEVGAALRRARDAGLRTIALTDRELTIVGADVLVPHPGFASGMPISASPLAAGFVLALLAARMEPASGIAREFASFPAALSNLGRPDPTIRIAARLRAADRRLVVAGSGPSRWVAASIARRINAVAGHERIVQATDVHIGDLRSDEWCGRADDALIVIEPRADAAHAESKRQVQREPAAVTWRIGGAQKEAEFQTRLPFASPALSSLCALYILELLLVELASA
jgi:DNA-binding MurR/RpiR family transcriptional regulator